MGTNLHPSTRAAFPAVFAVAIACVAWPTLAAAQPQDGDTGASSASANAKHGRDAQKDDDANRSDAARRSRADERRLLGGPGPAFDPYENDDASPKSQEDALMNEQRMTVVSPSELYSSGSPTLGGTGDGNAGGAIKRFGRSNSSAASGAVAGNAPGTNATGAVHRYGYNTGSLASPVYRNPYDMHSGTGQAYRSPW